MIAALIPEWLAWAIIGVCVLAMLLQATYQLGKARGMKKIQPALDTAHESAGRAYDALDRATAALQFMAGRIRKADPHLAEMAARILNGADEEEKDKRG